MTNDILYSIAETSAGQLIKAIDADKESTYVCPGCKEPFIFRNGLYNRPHFAHKNLNSNCTPETALQYSFTPETALHYSFKTLLYEKIKNHIDLNLPLKIHWDCSHCSAGRHSGNLLREAVEVKLEHNLGVCRPDIALLDKNDRTIAVIEVIVTHSPEQKTLIYYKQNKIAVVIYHLQSNEDVQRLDSSILEPDELNLCTNPRCLKCGKYMKKSRLLIVNIKCYKCGSPTKVAGSFLENVGIIDFSNADIPIANQHGCLLKFHFNNILQEKYIANTCRKCNRLIGDDYPRLRNIFSNSLINTEYSTQEVRTEYSCPRCLNIK